MSIVLAEETGLAAPVLLVVLLVASVAAVWGLSAAGTFRRRPDETLQRLFAQDPIMPMFCNLLAAMAVYFGASMIGYVILIAIDGAPATANPKDLLVGGNLVLLAIVMSTAAFISLIAGLGVFIPDGFARVGLDRSPLQGVKYGAATILAVLPLVMFVMFSSEWVYHWTGVKPQSHELLEAMKPDKPLVRLGGIFAAVVVAPLSEELLFRGHLQPILRRLFSRWSSRSQPRALPPMSSAYAMPYAVQPTFPPQPQTYPAVAYPSQPQGYLQPPPAAMQMSTAPLNYQLPPPTSAASLGSSVGAILITSMCFAAVHPMWSWPSIFVLAIGLGFAYERTGNLWVPIVMHACFNALMTSIFLVSV